MRILPKGIREFALRQRHAIEERLVRLRFQTRAANLFGEGTEVHSDSSSLVKVVKGGGLLSPQVRRAFLGKATHEDLFIPKNEFEFAAENWSDLVNMANWRARIVAHSGKTRFIANIGGRQLFMKSGPLHELDSLVKFSRGIKLGRQISIRTPQPIFSLQGIHPSGASYWPIVMEDVSGLKTVREVQEEHPEHKEVIGRLALDAQIQLYKRYRINSTIKHEEALTNLLVERFDPKSGKINFVMLDFKYIPK